MSLDVYLTLDACPTCGRGEEVYWANITHNLNMMAQEAGIYNALWRPDEHGYELAKQVGVTLKYGIAKMKGDPERFKKFDASNGWGTYEQFVPWLERYLDACEKYPESRVRVSR